MRIALVSHYYPPHVGGLEAVVQQQAWALTQLGHDVVVLTTAVPDLPGVRHEDGVEVWRLSGPNPFEPAGIPFPLTSPVDFLRAVRRIGPVDVVHAHDILYPTTWMAALWAWLTRRPLVVHQHVALIDHPRRVVGWVQRAVYAAAGRLIGLKAEVFVHINSRVEQMLQGLGLPPEKLVFLPNGIDHTMFAQAEGEHDRRALRARHGIPVDKTVALFVARPVPKKGFHVLMAATSPSYLIVTVGGHGTGMDEAGEVLHLGPLPTRDVAEIMRASDIFVLPSVAEGFPLTIQEAMASGLAIVTTNDPGYERYQLDRSKMRLIEPRAEEVRDALLELAAEPRLRAAMGEYACDYARARFSWRRHAQELHELYGGLVHTHGSRLEGRGQRTD